MDSVVPESNLEISTNTKTSEVIVTTKTFTKSISTQHFLVTSDNEIASSFDEVNLLQPSSLSTRRIVLEKEWDRLIEPSLQSDIPSPLLTEKTLPIGSILKHEVKESNKLKSVDNNSYSCNDHYIEYKTMHDSKYLKRFLSICTKFVLIAIIVALSAHNILVRLPTSLTLHRYYDRLIFRTKVLQKVRESHTFLSDNFIKVFSNTFKLQQKQQHHRQLIRERKTHKKKKIGTTNNNKKTGKKYGSTLNAKYKKNATSPTIPRTEAPTASPTSAPTSAPIRVLYIVTTLAEYNTGARSTKRGSDRLQETTIPILRESVTSMLQDGYDVDAYLVCHFTLTASREALIRNALPDRVNLEVWNDATPLGYDTGKQPFQKLEYRTLHLSRQHRFVIKDRILDYDMFVNFEDDMYISGTHITHFRAVSNELQLLYDDAPSSGVNPRYVRNTVEALNHFFGLLNQKQMKRLIPGFMRVEVLVDEDNYGAQTNTGPVPVDLDFGNSNTNLEDEISEVDSSVCCNLSASATNENRPAAPTSDKLIIWETNILPLGIRKMTAHSWLQWVVLQRGPNQNELAFDEIIGDYWTNRNHAFYSQQVRRPAPHEFKYINNQGGWMATQQQLKVWHSDICPGGFLPPYEAPHYNYDGLDMRNVEWYSGGMQLSTIRHACNMQRIILLDPKNFSKSLLYHTANNKQKQLTHKRDEFFVKANTLLGQLNTIKKRAERELPANAY